ncbi:MAG TPA: efflux RND transporter periplasmic adaptor subunit [Clostridia bacterium]|nr:efflux RND transporter periplasmic adaptor subunit [Clostridia bacterium]
MKKTVTIVTVLVILSVVWFLGYNYYTGKRTMAARKPQYAAAAAKIDRIEAKVSASGVVEPVKREMLKAEAHDTVEEVLVKENSIVKEGTKLIAFENGSDTITAPYDGVLSEILVKDEDDVKAGQELVSFFDNRNFITRINVDELDLPSIKTRQKAQITVNAFPGTGFTGTVSDIKQEGEAENGVSSFQVTITFDDIGNIRAGMTTEVVIVTAAKEKALVIPIEAVRTVEDGKAVTVVGSDGITTELRKVEIGINSNTMVEITKGLAEGERVQLPQAVNTQTDIKTMIRGGSPM